MSSVFGFWEDLNFKWYFDFEDKLQQSCPAPEVFSTYTIFL